MEITRLNRRSSYEEITEQIKSQIMNGQLKPGEQLPSTKELSEQFAVGRSTMREALSALKAMGLIEIRQGEGCTVKSFNAAEMELKLASSMMSKAMLLDLLEARKALEVSNAALAAEKRNEHDLDVFRMSLKAMEHHFGDEREGEKADLSFHLTLAKATHNSVLVRLFESISDTMEAAIRETRRHYMYADENVSKQLWKEHKQIFIAIEAGDAKAAEEAMRSHLFHVERVLTQFLN